MLIRLGLTWFRIYILFSLLPLSFHDLAWSTIAYLRYLNVTDSEGWLEIDQEKLRSRTSLLTWALTALTLAIFVPFGHHLISNELEVNIPFLLFFARTFFFIFILLRYNRSNLWNIFNNNSLQDYYFFC